jgi:hypothetical protein
MKLTRSQMNRLLKDFTGPVRRAFEQAIRTAKGRVNIAAVERAIVSGDIDAVMIAIGMREGVWTGVTEEIRRTYAASGAFIVAADVPKKFSAAFNISNPRAEGWLRNNSSQLITGNLQPEQRSAIQTVLQNGFVKGNNPRTTALDIVGRISKETGRRTGGVLGLTGQQAGYAVNASNELASLDSHYFTRRLRDKRFDNAVKRSIKEGKPLPVETRNKIVARYEDRLLKHRGENIARTEALAALNEASDEALRQAVIGEGLAPANAVTRIWRHSFAGHERPGHLMMNGQERGIGEFFVNPLTDVALLHPGNGPGSETINCRCYLEHKIDFVAVELAA